MRRGVELYRDRPEAFKAVVRNGMKQDWSWDRSAVAYEDLYRRIAGGR